jgi:ketosteroid isomerase-like protein
MLQRSKFRPRILFAIALLLSFTPAVLAADNDGHDSDRDALRKLCATYEDAVNSNNLSKLKPLLADGFTGVMESAEEIKSYNDLEAFWKKIWVILGSGGRYHVKVITDQTDFIGDLAVSRGYTEESFHTTSGKDYAVQARWTAITCKQNGEWKIFRVQGTINALDNPAITEMVKQAKICFGAVGTILGLALGFILRGFLIKKKIPNPATA